MIRMLGVLCALALCTTTVTANDGAESTDSSSIYRKKVGGIAWIEATAGPSRYKPFKYIAHVPGAEDVPGGVPNAQLTGPEFGGAIGLGLGTFNIGARIRSANYDVIKLNTAGLDMNFLIRVPYVHPYVRLGINYHWVSGDKSALVFGVPDEVVLSNLRANGAGVTLGVGIRVPIIKYISIAAGVDISMVGIFVQGTGTLRGMSVDVDSGGALGLQTSGTFALTFHI